MNLDNETNIGDIVFTGANIQSPINIYVNYSNPHKQSLIKKLIVWIKKILKIN